MAWIAGAAAFESQIASRLASLSVRPQGGQLNIQVPVESNHAVDASSATIVEIVRRHAASQPGQVAYTFLRDEAGDQLNLTFGELDRKASAIAFFLEGLGMSGERALLLLPSGLEYVTAFFGCLYAGVIAVPGFPVRFGRLRRDEVWFRAVLADAAPRLAFVATRTVDRQLRSAGLDPGISSLQWVCTQDVDDTCAHRWQHAPHRADGIAFLQYTSGSTSRPKGVAINHSNILHNQRVIHAAYSHDQSSTVVGWLPLHHDMGLVGTVLQPAYLGARSVLIPPTRFLRDPMCWLQAISRYQAHSSSAPNFAYELCTRRATPERKIDLDLSSWRVAVNGAEPVRAETMERFVTSFHDCGFRAEAFRPSYGLAESTLMVTGARSSVLPRVKRLSSHALEQNKVQDADETEAQRVIVGCGAPLLGQEVKVVNPVTLESNGEQMVGEIWVRGPSVGQGYWNHPEETVRSFQARLASNGDACFLRTGDLGFLSDGELFVTGRMNDLVIVRGRNIYPQDIELTVQKCDAALRRGCGAAFSVQVKGQDALVVVNEVERHSDIALEKVVQAIREAVMAEHGVQVYAVLLLKTGSISMTTSGKVKRNACRNSFLANELQVVGGRTFSLAQTDSSDVDLRLTRADVLQTPPKLRHELVESHLRSALARMMKLDVDEITANQSLVSLGLDSLAAVQLSNMVESDLGLRLDMSDILQEFSVSALVEAVLDQLRPIDETRSDQVEESGHGIECPLSYGQRGLWILHQAAPQSAAYNLSTALRLKTGLNTEALRRGFHELVARHEMLRATFPIQDGEPLLVIRRPEELCLDRHFEYLDLNACDILRLPALLAEEAKRPFSLDEPPIRLILFRLASEGHALILILHHIIADFQSFAILFKELGALYAAECGRESEMLPKVRASYRDFVRWQASMVEGATGESLWSYWRNQLSGDLPILQLPADRPRPPVQSYRGASEPVRLDSGLSRKIGRIARRSNATPFMVLLACFQIVLHRISGQNDLLVGCPTSARNHSPFRETVGYCVNPVVLRSRYDSELTFSSYLQQVRTTTLEAFKHQDYPFAILVDKLHPQRDRSIPALFQTMFVWQKAHAGEDQALGLVALGRGGVSLELGDLPCETIALEASSSQFDLTLMMTETDSEILGTFKYNVDLFDSMTIRSLARQFSVLLTAIADDPEKPVSRLPLVTELEGRRLVREWNPSQPVNPTDDRCVHELFEEQAMRRPEATALIVGDKELSYSQLNAQANQFARHLRGLGVRTDVRVGVCLNRSVEMIVAVLGIWKAGGAYVPFHERDPKARLATLIERSSIQVLVTHEQLLDRLPEQLPRVLLLDLDLDLIGLEEESNLGTAVPSRSLAYVIHTSGSTGEPKGTMIEHRSVVHLLAGLREAIYQVHGNNRLIVGLNAPLAFDSSVKQLLTLAMGHTLCLMSEDIRRNGRTLLACVRETGLQVLDCTPTQVQLLLEAGFSQIAPPVTLLVGGEPVPPETWNVLAALGSVPSYNLYGPTECTVDATICQITGETGPSIGRPLGCNRVYLLDENLETVPAGVPGEIFISGESVARGYLGLPDLTAEKFVPDPISNTAGSRMYRTGDRARYLANGNIQFIGRVDRQVKIRGFRIELGEIEAALRECAGVRDAAVIVRNDSQEIKHLIGYVVANEKHASNRYRQFLATKLPEYMVPTVVVTVPSIPITTNGKRDYAALPLPEVTAMERGDDYMAPQSDIEEYLVELWTHTLRVQPIGIHDNFFALGGDSLQATRLIGEIQKRYPSDTPLLALFFQEPTIAALAQALSDSSGGRVTDEMQAIGSTNKTLNR